MYEFIAAPATAWLLAQTIKFSISALKGVVDFKWFIRAGGMPSAHSSTVVALSTVIGLFAGFSSMVFAVTATFAGIVIYDSVGVRQAVGNHALLLKKLLKDAGDKTLVHEPQGHTLAEVLGGILLGLVVGASYAASELSAFTDFLSAPLEGLEFRIAWILSLALLILAVIYRRIAFANKKGFVYKRIRKKIFYSAILPAMTSFLFIAAAQQEINIFNWRFWVWTTIAFIVISQSVYFVRLYSKANLLAAEESPQKRYVKSARRNSSKRKSK